MSETAARPQDQELVATLFELGREVSAVLDFDELLRRIPGLIARLTSFTGFYVYMLDERRQELKIGVREGLSIDMVLNVRLRSVRASSARRGRAEGDHRERRARGSAAMSGSCPASTRSRLSLFAEEPHAGAPQPAQRQGRGLYERERNSSSPSSGPTVAQALANARSSSRSALFGYARRRSRRSRARLAEILDVDECN